MRWGSLTRHLGTAVAALIVLAACGGTSGGGTASCNAKTATSASDCGGMDSLVAAAKKEGELNVIALPPDWANYGAIISGFTAKYGIKVNSANPNGSSQEEVDAIKQLQGTNRAPDVVDVGMKVALANTTLFAPYKVTGWADILQGQKESTGLWVRTTAASWASATTRARCPRSTPSRTCSDRLTRARSPWRETRPSRTRRSTA